VRLWGGMVMADLVNEFSPLSDLGGSAAAGE
jgi:hypothetical protein